MALNDKANKSKAGKKGGKTGGANRAKKLTPAERSRIAKQGGEARQKKSM